MIRLFGFDILHVVLKESLHRLAAGLDLESPSWFHSSWKWTNGQASLPWWIIHDSDAGIAYLMVESRQPINPIETHVCLDWRMCVTDSTLTAGGWEGGAALRGHPQVCWARVKHHIKHLSWRADADFPKILSLSRTREHQDQMKVCTVLSPSGKPTHV